MTEVQPGTDSQADSKCRLQEFAQRAGMPLPVYQTFNEVNQHTPVPQFRSRLWVDKMLFTSQNAFPSKKAAERNVAEHALVGLLEKVKNEGRAHVSQDTILCKQIMNEYAKKMNMEIPTYTTNPSNTVIPMFISSLSLNGATFTGDPSKNKKDAEQSAARAAILSILESETGCTTMAVLVKSKFKYYEALKQVKDPFTGQEQCMDSHPGPEPNPVSVQIAPLENPNPLSSLKRKAVETLEATSSIPCPVQNALSIATIPQSGSEPFPVLTLPSGSTMNGPCTNQPISQPIHEFKKAKHAQTSVAAITTSIEFVPESGQPTPAPVLSTSAKKRKSKKKRKKAQRQAELTAGMLPPSQVPTCYV